MLLMVLVPVLLVSPSALMNAAPFEPMVIGSLAKFMFERITSFSAMFHTTMVVPWSVSNDMVDASCVPLLAPLNHHT